VRGPKPSKNLSLLRHKGSGIVSHAAAADDLVHARNAAKSLYIVSIQFEHTLKKTVRLRQNFWSQDAQENGSSLKNEVHRDGLWRSFRAPRLGGN
jgi:hypothetical protein